MNIPTTLPPTETAYRAIKHAVIASDSPYRHGYDADNVLFGLFTNEGSFDDFDTAFDSLVAVYGGLSRSDFDAMVYAQVFWQAGQEQRKVAA